MVGDNGHSRLVNRRLAAAHFYLSLEKNADIVKTESQKQSCVDTALMQIYFAMLSYLNELLDYHKQMGSVSSYNLGEVLQDKGGLFNTVYEFDELKQWMKKERSELALLTQLPIDLLDISEHNPPEEVESSHQNRKFTSHGTGHGVGLQLIAVTDKTEKPSLFSNKCVKQLLSKLQQLIERQREHQIEY